MASLTALPTPECVCVASGQLAVFQFTGGHKVSCRLSVAATSIRETSSGSTTSRPMAHLFLGQSKGSIATVGRISGSSPRDGHYRFVHRYHLLRQ